MQFIRITLLLLWLPLSGIAQGIYLEKAISANDHKRKKPLQEALEAQCAGVSIKLKVAKDGSIKCGNETFENLYLKPIQSRITENQGNVYEGRTEEFFIFAEVDGDSSIAYQSLETLCAVYAEMLSGIENGQRRRKSVRIVLSGDVPLNRIVLAQTRYFHVDEDLQKPDARWNGNQVATASITFSKHYSWNGEGNMPNMQYMSIMGQVKNAHKVGRLVRLSAIPESLNAFSILDGTGAEFLEVSDLKLFTTYRKNKKMY